MSKKGSIRIHRATMSDAKLFARPNKVTDKSGLLLDLEKERENTIHTFIEQRDYSDLDVSLGSGTADVFKALKNTIRRTFNDYKPPKMTLIALIKASQGSRTCYADDVHNDLFHQSRDPQHWYSDCDLSQRAKELSNTWVKYFVDARDPNAMDMFNLFVQLFNNEKILRDRLTLEEMLNGLGGDSDEVFMFEEDRDICEDEEELWWKAIKHRNIANRFMYCAYEYPNLLTHQMRHITDYHMVRLHGNDVQDIFAQKMHLHELLYKDPETMLIEEYNNQNDPLATPMYPEIDSDKAKINWLFLAEVYQVSNLWCKKYGL